jgi:hypothetical protein
MSLHSLVSSKKILATCCGLGLAVGVLAFRAQADPWDKKTYLTVDKTIQVQDRVLPAGTYVLKLLDSPADRHVVQIFSQDERHIIDTVLAMPNYRLRPTGHSRFLFYETPPGAAPALRAWFYPGDNFGQEFRYPKHLAMMQTVQQTEQTRIEKQAEETRVTETQSQAPQEEAVAPPPAPVQEETVTQQETTQTEQPVEIAQATPPPAPAERAPAPAPAPTELPKTASPFPLIGLGGLLSLGLYSLLRLKIFA